MKWYQYFRPRNWGIIKVYRDFENYSDWIKTIKREEDNPKSNFNRWKLQHTKLYYIYVIVSLDEPDRVLP